jgi:DNA-binding response OmpR family regulator
VHTPCDARRGSDRTPPAATLAAPQFVSSAPSALVVSTDALLAALLGVAVETLGYAAAFPAAGEPARLALGRLRPALVLVDCTDEDACANGLLGPATMLGAGLVLFGDAPSMTRRRELAARHGAALLTMPTTWQEMAATIEKALRK